MADVPAHLRYTAEHEWAKLVEGNTIRVGITDYAQDSLGDIVFVSVHEVGAELTAGDVFGEVESTKSVSDLFVPLSGTVTARNELLDDQPELVNSDPYGNGWIVEFTITDAAELDQLLDAETYRVTTGG